MRVRSIRPRLDWDEKLLPAVVLLSATPGVLSVGEGLLDLIVNVVLAVALAAIVPFWRRAPRLSAAGVWGVLIVWLVWLNWGTGGEMDPWDLLPFGMAVALATYGPARYGQPAWTSSFSLGLALLWAGATALMWFNWTDLSGGTGITIALLQAVFYAAIFVMGQSQRIREEQRLDQIREMGREDRQRLSREVHDSLSRSLTVINAQATAGVATGDPEALTRIRDISSTALTEMRSLLASLRNSEEVGELSDLSDNGDIGLQSKEDIITAIQDMVDGFANAGLDLTPDVPQGGERVRMMKMAPEEVHFTVYRILGEALTNVVRHQGQDSRVVVTVEHDVPQLRLHVRVESWGGTPSRRTASTGAGTGLAGLRERVEELGGDLDWSGDGADHFIVDGRIPFVKGGENAAE